MAPDRILAMNLNSGVFGVLGNGNSLFVRILEFIFLPVCRIIIYVIGNAFKFHIVPDDMIMKTGLPAEIGICFPGINRAYSFVLIDDYANRTGMPLRVIAPCFFWR